MRAKSSRRHNRTLLASLSTCLGLFLSLSVWSSVMANWLLHYPCHLSLSCLSLLCFSFLPFFSFFVALLNSHCLSLYLPHRSLSLSASSSPLLHSPSLLPHLLSTPFPFLLPLFRLYKVQLGFGAFGLQAWRQEDALSEYALLGSLCVTLYFFALLFYPSLLTFVRVFVLLLYPLSHGHPVFLWVFLFNGRRPSASDILLRSDKTKSAFRN